LSSFFLKAKDEQVQVIIRHLIHLTNEKKVKIKYIRGENSGKIYNLQNQINDNHLKLVCQFEFTAPDSPQENGKVERKFAALYVMV
jgi:hypothetical protein